MRVTRQKASENRQRVLRLAARRFRERGLGGIGVAELMNEAGLTHGGFYKQFASKDDLAVQACAWAIADNVASYRELAENSTFSSAVSALVSVGHRDTPGEGCVLAALGAEIARSEEPLRREVTEGVRKILDSLAGLVPGRSQKRSREKAVVAYAAIVGALIIARAVDDPELSGEILKSVRGSLAGAR